MREHSPSALASRSSTDNQRSTARPAHPLLHLQASAGNRAVAQLVSGPTVQRCGSIPHDECPCNADGEPPLQRLADGAGLVSSVAVAPVSEFGTRLPELSTGLSEVQATDTADVSGRMPGLTDRRPEGTPAIGPASAAGPAPVAQPAAEVARPTTISPPVSTLDPGARPVLDLTGNADPSLAAQAANTALTSLDNDAAAANREVTTDHGENAVAQAAPRVEVRPTAVLPPAVALPRPAPPTPAASGSASMAQAEASLTGYLDQRVASAGATLRGQETSEHERTNQALGKGQQQLDQAAIDTASRQRSLGAQTQTAVAGDRERWTQASRELHSAHQTQTRSRLTALHGTVAGVVGDADKQGRAEYAGAEQAAHVEQAKEPAAPQGGLLSRALGAASGLFDRLRQAVGGIFERARQAVHGVYEAARSKVGGLIREVVDGVRAGAAAVAERIRAAARAARETIAARIRAGIEAVRQAAAGLAALGRRVLATVSQGVRRAAAAIARAGRAATDALAKAASAVTSGLNAVARMLATLAAYEPLPQGLFAFAEKYGKRAEQLSSSVPAGAVTSDIGGATSPPTNGDPLATGPAGGCGVCKGSAGNSGTEAHALVQKQFFTQYPDAMIEYPIPQRTRGVLEVDLARHRPDGALAIGEIKPANEKGYTDGVSSIAKYLNGIGELDPGLRVVPLTELIAPTFFPNPEGGPTCPTQKLFVYPPVGGVYGYHCLPEYDKMMASGLCKCGQKVPVPVGDKKTADDKEKEKNQDTPVGDPVLAKEIWAAIGILAVAVAAVLLWPEPIGKGVGAVAAIASFAALMIMLNKDKSDTTA